MPCKSSTCRNCRLKRRFVLAFRCLLAFIASVQLLTHLIGSQFMELQNAVLMRQAAEDPLQFRRHSIAMGAMPHNVVPSFAP